MHRRNISLRPASRTAIRTALPAIGIIAALALAGCTSSDSGKKADATSPLQKYLSTLYDGEQSTQEEQEAQFKKAEDLVAKCMAKEGFEYQPSTGVGGPVFRSDLGDSSDLGNDPQPGTEKFAQQYGYGIVDGPGVRGKIQPDTENVDPNFEYTSSLSESEWQAYDEALYGPTTPAEDDAADGAATQIDPSNAGCYAKAGQEARGEDSSMDFSNDPETKEVFENLQTMYMELYGGDGTTSSNADIAKLDQQWSDCMANAGYSEFTSPTSASNSLSEEYNKLAMPNGGSGEYVEPSKTDRDKFQTREIEIAKADVACKKKLKYDDKLQKIQFAREQRFIDENKKQLDALVAKYDTKKK